MESSVDTSTPLIFIEMSPTKGIKQVSLKPTELAERSLAAMDNAMLAIKEMTKRFSQKMDDVVSSADEVEVCFGVKLTMEGSAIITKAGVEATIDVKLTYKRG